jgi:hypothetical protein
MGGADGVMSGAHFMSRGVMSHEWRSYHES